MDSLVRPRTASPNSPPIKHARALSPRSVMVEFEFVEDENDTVQELGHLQQPMQGNLGFDCYFRDFGVGGTNKTSTNSHQLSPCGQRLNPRSNKRKLPAVDSLPRVINLRHRQVSNETMEWLTTCNSMSLNVTSSHSVSYTDDDESFTTQALRAKSKKPRVESVREPIEELWLGPLFENSQTVLTAITALPISVTRLDLDLRNALHLLPQAMPLLFGKHHLKTLGLRVFGDVGAVELAKWMNMNPNLKHFDLRGNRIGSTGARAIVRAIKSSSDANQSYQSLTHLNLSCNCILHGDMIGELLEMNSTLESLDLGFNWLGDNEVEDICIGLRNNTSLRELNLYGCHRISHTGMTFILDCLKKHNTSLHKIGLQAFDDEGKRLIEKINYWLKLNKAGRYLIKSFTESSTVSIEQVDRQPCNKTDRVTAPIGLWPLVLEKTKKDPDSIFHLVREGFGARIINYR